MRKPPQWTFGCDRTQLLLLKSVFLPGVLLEQHTVDQLKAFCNEHVKMWTGNRFVVLVTWGHGRAIKCEVEEVEPRDETLLFQNQYRLNEATSRYELMRIPSPPIGMKLLPTEEWRKKLDQYLDDLLERDFGNFPSKCMRGRDCLVQRDLLYPIHEYYLVASEEVSDSHSNSGLELIQWYEVQGNGWAMPQAHHPHPYRYALDDSC